MRSFRWATMLGAWLWCGEVSFPSSAQEAQTSSQEWYVSARLEEGVVSDGSSEKPFRSIREALEKARGSGEQPVVIHLDVGTYGKNSGDEFPLMLPRRCHFRGYGSRSTTLEGDPDKPVFLLPKGGIHVLRALRIEGGARGVAFETGPLSSDRSMLHLFDVSIARCDAGVEGSAGGSITISADGLRVASCDRGLFIASGANLSLTLVRSALSRNRDALLIEGSRAVVSISCDDCSFADQEGCGVRCTGGATPDCPKPWRFEGCVFERNGIGVSLEIPGGDVPLELFDCRFSENEQFGLALVGGGAPLEGCTRVEDCRFRWNGIGLHLLSCGRPVQISRCRVEDSVGNGVFCGLFVGQRSAVELRHSVLAGNGAAGLFGLSEVKDGLSLKVDHCTIADNLQSGIERKHRKLGSILLRVENSIVAFNARDLLRIEPAEVEGCLIREPGLDGPSAALTGDPLFLDREARDYRLAPDSPAIREGKALGALEAGAGK